MTYSVHVADVGGGRDAWRALRRELSPVPGLRHHEAGFAVDLGGPAARPPKVHLGRIGMLAWWDGPDALEAWLGDSSLGAAFASGWHAAVEPLRVYGEWSYLPELPATEIEADADEPAIAVTIGHTKLTQLGRFLPTSNKAENLALAQDGLVWGTALVQPPRKLATLTVWRTVAGMRDYAMGRSGSAHLDAIKEQRRKDFHHESAFIRLRPLAEEGTIDGLAPIARARAASAT